ncbi:MAG TPA: hypothetical protein VMB46_03815 [Methanomassiliicoccales archaeon]|nr:hypothetical protein [Methanomassiliicoccales archaeon]
MERSLDSLREAVRGSAIELFWEWWLASTQALVDMAGSEDAIKALRPYYMNANTSAMSQLSSRFENIAGRPDYMPWIIVLTTEAYLGGRTDVWFDEECLVREVHGCRLNGECPELCHMVCRELTENALRQSQIQAYLDIEKGQFKGDDSCRSVTWFESVHQTYDLRKMQKPEGVDVPRDLFDSLRLQYVSESWVFTTRAFMDQNAKVANEALRSYMRHSGLSYGIRLVERFPHEPRDRAFLETVMQTIGECHGRNQKCSPAEDLDEGEVTECPFAQAPEAICLQYEAFFNGMCEAINPSYEFVYQEKMTRGDSACRWVVQRRANRMASSETSGDSGLKALTLKYVNGEITKAEFSEMKKTLGV